MDIQAEKLELVKLLMETESEEVINSIKAVFKKTGHDFWNDLPEHVKESINRGLEDVRNKNPYEHDLVMKESRSKYGLGNTLE